MRSPAGSLITRGDDPAVGADDEYAEFLNAFGCRRVAGYVVNSGIRGCGERPQGGKCNQETAGFGHEYGSAGKVQMCSKNTTK